MDIVSELNIYLWSEHSSPHQGNCITCSTQGSRALSLYLLECKKISLWQKLLWNMSEKPQGCLHVSKNQYWWSLAKHSSCCPRLDAALKEEEVRHVSLAATGPQLPPCNTGEVSKNSYTYAPSSWSLWWGCRGVISAAEVYLEKWFPSNPGCVRNPLSLMEDSTQENPQFLLANLAFSWQFICIIFKHHWQIKLESFFSKLSGPLANHCIKANIYEKEQGHF